MNHILVKTFVCLCLFGCGAAARAQSFTDTNINYSVLSADDMTVSVDGLAQADSVVDIEIPATVTHEGRDYAVTEIADTAFSQQLELRTVTLPEGLRRIGDWAFKHCESLESVDIPSTVRELGEQAFAWCTSLKSVTLPEGLPEIPVLAFYYAQSLADIKIPSTVKTIGRSAFCAAPFVRVEIPEGVETLGSSVFMFCRKLRSVYLPSTLTSIGDKAFSITNILREIECAVPDPFECWPDFAGYTNNNAKLYVPVGTAERYRDVMCWKMFAHIVEKEFPNVTRSGCDDVTCDDPAANPNAKTEIYTLGGTPAGSSLADLRPGVYLVRTGTKVTKVAVN